MKFRFPHIKTHPFRGKDFQVFWRKWRRAKDEIPGKNVGRCEHRETRQPRIHIYPGQSPFEILLTTMHEGLHACFPDIEEAAVQEFDDDMKLLWQRMKVQISFEGQDNG